MGLSPLLAAAVMLGLALGPSASLDVCMCKSMQLRLGRRWSAAVLIHYQGSEAAILHALLHCCEAAFIHSADPQQCSNTTLNTIA